MAVSGVVTRNRLPDVLTEKLVIRPPASCRRRRFPEASYANHSCRPDGLPTEGQKWLVWKQVPGETTTPGTPSTSQGARTNQSDARPPLSLGYEEPKLTPLQYEILQAMRGLLA